MFRSKNTNRMLGFIVYRIINDPSPPKIDPQNKDRGEGEMG